MALRPTLQVVPGMTGKADMSFDPPMTLTMRGTVEMVIDGSSTATKADMAMGMKGAGAWKTPSGAGGKVVFDISGTVADTESAEVPTAVGKLPAVTWLKGPGEWAPFKPKDGSFTAEYPGAPQQQSQKNPRGDTTTTWTAATNGGAVAYVVSTTDFVV